MTRSPSALRRLFRYSIISVAGLLGLLVLTLVIVLVLLSTEAGSRFVWNAATNQFPDQIQAESFSGTLADSLTLHKLHIQLEGMQIRANQIQLDWQPWKLFSGALHVARIHLDQLHIDDHRPPSPPSDEPISVQDIDLPIALRLDDFQLRDLQYTKHNDESNDTPEPLVIDALNFAINTRANTIQLNDLSLHMPQLDAELQASVTPQGQYPTDADLQWVLHLPDLPEVRGGGSIQGDLKALTLQQTISAPDSISLNAELFDVIKTLRWTAELQADAVSIQHYAPDAPSINVSTHLHTEGELEDFLLTGTLGAKTEEFGHWTSDLNLRLRDQANLLINTLDIRHAEQSTQLQLTGEADIKKQLVDLDGNWRALQWPLDETEALIAKSETGTFSLKGDLEDYALTLDTTVWTPQTDQLPITLRGQGDQEHFVLTQLDTLFSEGKFETTGEVKWAVDPLQFTLAGNWAGLQLVLPDQQIASPKGQFDLAGDLDAYTLELETEVRGETIPDTQLALSGKGSDAHFDIRRLHTELLEGALDLAGRVQWQPTVSWDLQLKGDGINPAELAADWPGKLALSAMVKGELQEAGPVAQIQNTEITGRLRDFPFNAKLAADVTPALATIHSLAVQSGQSLLNASGTVKDQETLDLALTLKSPKLTELHPQANGSLTADATLRGPIAAPKVLANLNGKTIRFEDTRVESVVAKLDLNLAALKQGTGKSTDRLTIKLDAEKIQLGTTQVPSISLDGDGTLSAHTISARVESDQGDLITRLTGGIQGLAQNDATTQPTWSGKLEKLDLQNTSLGDWASSKPADIKANANQARVQDFCLAQDATQLCSEATWSTEKGWTADLDLSALSLARLAEFLPPGVNAEGSVGVTGQARGQGNAVLADLKLTTTEGRFFVPDNQDTQTPALHFAPSEAIVKLDRAGLNATVQLNIDQPTLSPISATLEAPGFAPGRDLSDVPLRGKITSHIADLAFIETFTTELEDVKASLDVDLQLAGTLAQPGIAGKVDLNGQMLIPRAGLDLQDIQFNATSDADNQIALNGRVRSGEGNLTIDGLLSPFAQDHPMQLTVKGDQLEVINLPEAWVLASPDLDIKLKGNRLDVNGSVDIPKAEIQPVGVESAVGVSDDVIILQDEKDKAAVPLDVYGKIAVTLGDQINIDASGFTGRITGGIETRLRPKKPITAVGELNIVDGKYEAYGQKIAVSKGKILFAGGPIDSPNLEVEATRTTKGVTAGVRVTGTPDAPDLALFSSPSMNQDSILSYLLLGRPLGEASSSESALLLSAAQSVGFKGADMVTQSIGQSLGLDEFSIAGGTQEDAALQVGKYLTPKLYISYGVGLFEPVTQLKMRYDLGRRWALEAVSGTNSSMDFLYKYEK